MYKSTLIVINFQADFFLRSILLIFEKELTIFPFLKQYNEVHNSYFSSLTLYDFFPELND